MYAKILDFLKCQYCIGELFLGWWGWGGGIVSVLCVCFDFVA